MRIIGLLLLFFALESFAQEEGKLEFRDVASGLRCPTCTGLSVLESDAKFSNQIKDEVQEQLEKGRSKEEIYRFFVERYGPWILREPPKEGFNFFAWAFPIGLLVFGPILVWFFIWRNRAETPSFGVRPTREILSQMKEELDSLKKA